MTKLWNWFLTIAGLYLILEGIGSLFYATGPDIFQIGRVIRVVIGLILVFHDKLM